VTHRRTLVFAAAMIGTAAVIAIPAAPAHANAPCKAGYECIHWYYSNAQYTTLVGSTYLFCNGTSSTIGEVTGYVRVENDECG
jgi:Family of unknown function (DUF6289)